MSLAGRRQALCWLLIAFSGTFVGCIGGGKGVEPPTYACADCNVVLVSLDTLRADRLGTYGHSRPTSPNIDALAARSTVFERAYSVSYHTADSHMSVFTSTYPSVHLVRNAAKGGGRALDEVVPTLAELLQGAGYSTAGFHGGGNVSPLYGFDRGFEHYVNGDMDDALAWLRQAPAEPFFLFFHAYYTHDPYTPETLAFGQDYEGDIVSRRDELLAMTENGSFLELRDTFWEQVDSSDPQDLEHLLALYDSEIREIDARFGELLTAIEALPGETLIVLMSDHGEEFFEHGRFLHDQLYDELLHVPLVVHHPSAPPRRVSTRVSLIDLAPTVLEMVGAELPASFQGESLVAVAEGQRVPEFVFSEKLRRLPGDAGPPGRGLSAYSLVQDEVKLILRGEPEVYDLESDPGEQENLGRESRELRRLVALGKQIARDNQAQREVMGIGGAGAEAALDDETRDQLKALGYLQ
ncbi:MAG: sulfatase [Acidobacteriota bacterium]